MNPVLSQFRATPHLQSMKNTNCLLKSLALVAGLLSIASIGFGAQTYRVWTNSAGTQLWSTPGNWSNNVVPSANDTVLFNTNAATGTVGPAGTVNSYVDASFTGSITNLLFMNTNGAHNVRVTNTLTIKGTAGASSSATPTAQGNMIFVGSGADDGTTASVYATIQGNTLNISNRNGYMVIRQGAASAGAHMATLDMSGLDNFNATLADIVLAYDTSGTVPAANARPSGTIYFARTNVVTFVDTGTVFSLGHMVNGNANNQVSYAHLGQSNIFLMDALTRIGGAKMSTGATLDFKSTITDGWFKIRGIDGSSRSAGWNIGDNSALTGTGSTATKGTADFGRGGVDVLVTNIFVARGANSSSYTGNSTGTLTFGGGTTNGSVIDVTTLEIGYQSGAIATATGTVNVQSNGLLVVGGDVRLARTVAGTANLPTGVLNINGGTVTVAGNLVDGGGNTTLVVSNNGSLNLKPSGDSVAGNITAKTVIVGIGAITNYDTLAATTLTVASPATGFTVYAGESVSPVAVGTAGTLAVNGDLGLTSANVKLDLGYSGSSDQIAVSGALTLNGTTYITINPMDGFGVGTYPVLTYGTALIGDVTNNLAVAATGVITNSRYSFYFETNSTPGTVNLQVSSASANLTWSGDGAANLWDVRTSANWNNQTETFYALDPVTFDDNSTNPVVNLVGTLVPTSVSVGSTQDYTFRGSGKISGSVGITINRDHALIVLNTNDNTGLTMINETSSLQLGNGTNANGAVGPGEIQNNSALIFNSYTTQNVANVISQSGSITKRGPGATRLAGANTYLGTATIEAGTLVAGSTTALGSTSGATAITNGGTLDVGGFNLGDEPVIVSGAGVAGKGAIVNTGGSQGNAFDNIALAGDAVFGGPNRWDIDGISSSGVKLGLQGNGFKLTKVGGNQVSVTSYNPNWYWNTALGDIDLQGGILSIQAYVTLGDNTKPMIIRSNAAVEFCHNGPALLDKPISMTNGCIQARFFSSNYPPYVDLSGPITLTGSNTFDVFSNAMSLVVEGEISGSGTLNKGIGGHTEGGNTSVGTGILVLVASNSFTGDLRVQTGTLILSNSASVASAANIVMAGGTLDASPRTDGTLTLATGQTLKGNGTVNGIVTSPANSTVSPGTNSTAAILTLKNTTTLRGTTLMNITKSGVTLTADKLAVTGTLDLGGTLTVSLAGSTGLAVGDKFTLFTATTFANSFSQVNLPGGPSVIWTNKTAIDGTIEVLQAEPTARPTLTNSLSSGGLKLSWDTAYTSYVLEGETNTVSVGLTTNSADWHPVPGVSGNQVTIPVDPANGSAFFRLRK
jgi:autotransporter-associated beta strand protein